MPSELLHGLQPAIELLGLSLLHFLWQGALVALVWWLARAALARAGAASQAACGQIAMLAFAAAPLLTLWWLARSPEPAAGALGALVADTLQSGTDWAQEGAAGASLLHVVVALWLAGVCLLALRTALDWRRTRRISALAQPAGSAWRRRMNDLARRLGLRRVPELRELGGLVSPYLFGWLRPVVVMPLGLMARLPQDQVEALLLHELAHARRLDYLANLLQVAVEILLFHHPLVHLVSRQLRADRERACDDLVIAAGASRLAYARALAALEVARHAGEAGAGFVSAQPGLAPAASGGLLLNRIERIAGVEESRSRRGPPALSPLLGAALAAVILLLSLTLTQRTEVMSRWAGLSLPGISLASLGLHLELAEPRALELPERRMRLPALPMAAPNDRPAPASSSAVLPIPRVESEATTLPAASLNGLDLPLPAPTRGLLSAPAAIAVPDAELASRPNALQTRAPHYPRNARLQGQEGHVVLSFSLGADGRPQALRVVESSRPGVFDRAAREALQDWRFAPGVGSPGQRFEQRFDFRLASEEQTSSLAARPGDCESGVGTRFCR